MTTTTEHVFLPGMKVEWLQRVSAATSVHRAGTVLPRDSALLTDEDRERADRGEIVPVQDWLGKVHRVERELLEPEGYREAQNHLRCVEDALARVRTAQHAVAEARYALAFVMIFEDPEDGNDADFALDSAEGSLREVSRILRLNGART